MPKLNQIDLSIAGTGLRLTAAKPEDAFELDAGYEAFTRAASGCADVELLVTSQKKHHEPDAELVFDAGSNWRLARRGDTNYVLLSSPVMKPQLYKLLAINHDFTKGTIYALNGSRGAFPLRYPLDEVLMVNLLGQGRGVEFHGLGVDVGNAGIVFAGTSGAGKSTLADLWKEREALILSDDRLVVRAAGNGKDGFLLYGTPWHGDARVSAYGGVPLRRIMILSQAPENRLVRLDAAEAATQLFVRCFPTFWSVSGMQFTTDLIVQICCQVPCYRLEFRPEQSALDTAVSGLFSE